MGVAALPFTRSLVRKPQHLQPWNSIEAWITVHENETRSFRLQKPSSVRAVNVENFNVSIRIINPVGNCKITNDRNLQPPSAIVKIHSVAHLKRLAANGCNRFTEGLTNLGWQFFKKLNHLD